MSENSKRVEDQDARDDAIDVTRSFIVRAPAGSGKTRLLIQRYLALLARVEEPEEIIAITFTRKAAAEMRERVLSAFADAKDDASELDSVTRRLALNALARDAERQWQLAANASRLRIQTIDSLNASITRQMPLAARFGAQPESVDDASALYREAARAVLAEVNATGPLAENIGVLLAHLDNNLPDAEELLANMLRAREQWLRNLSGMSEREVLEGALMRARTHAVADVARYFPVEEESETLALAGFAGRNWPESRTDAGVLALNTLSVWPRADETDSVAWLGIAKLLLTETGGWRKRRGLNVNCGFPPGEGKEQKAEFTAAKGRMGDLLERLRSHPHSNAVSFALDNLRQLPPACYTEQQWEALGAIVRLLPYATGMLWATFGAHGQSDFTQIAQSASIALGTDEAPSDLALALDYRIQHLLVDEFQDTSVTQFELLEKLTRGWDAGDGRTLFLVGDPMQSIYRFREAEVKLFGRAARLGIGTVALTQLQLTVNFRSQPAVVEWVNRAFATLMPAVEDEEAGQVPYELSVAFVKGVESMPSAVTWHPHFVRSEDSDGDAYEAITPDANEVEARRVVNIIRESLKQIALARENDPQAKSQQIALLVRNRTHLAKIVPALKATGIPFRAVDIDPLKDRPVVQDLLAITRALLHPADRIAWLAILRAPWCGLTLNDLAVLVGGAHTVEGALVPDRRTLWEIVNDDSRLVLLSGDGRARLVMLREKLAPALGLRRRQPLRELVECTWLALCGPACLPKRDDLEDANQLLDLLESEAVSQTGGGHICDLEALDARVARLFAGNRAQTGGEAAAVQIMTIHKAKGLEFDTVIVPALHRIPRRDDRKLLTWVEQIVPETGEQELLLAPVRESGATGESDAIYRYVQQRDRDKQLQEDVRLLYVAATRAKRHLHLLGTVSVTDDKDGENIAPPRAGSLLASLWPSVEPVFAEAVRTPNTTPAPVAAADNAHTPATRSAFRLSRLQALPQMPTSISAVMTKAPGDLATTVDFEWAGETARHVGTVVHAFLQRIADEGLARWDRERVGGASGAIEVELRRLGVVAGELSVAITRVAEALIKTLDDERGRWALDAHSQARSEWRLSGVMTDGIVNVAIDRTFVDSDGVRWIIDFKTGGHDGGDVAAFLDNEQKRYRQQLETYAALLQLLAGDSVPSATRLGLYFPQLMGWREWEWQPA